MRAMNVVGVEEKQKSAIAMIIEPLQSSFDTVSQLAFPIPPGPESKAVEPLGETEVGSEIPPTGDGGRCVPLVMHHFGHHGQVVWRCKIVVHTMPQCVET